jgi:hypothetical protein
LERCDVVEFPKIEQRHARKEDGAAMACMMSAVCSGKVANPMPIVAAHSAQPTKAWTRTITYFIRFILLLFLGLLETIQIIPISLQERPPISRLSHSAGVFLPNQVSTVARRWQTQDKPVCPTPMTNVMGKYRRNFTSALSAPSLYFPVETDRAEEEIPFRDVR